ncbi:transmembrane protein 254-like [Diadema antillarum]|uniref:transmembrane protein 254-like n=1 Tax=Diadema antillarum TaxID=105358 RepID=UPI003A8AFF42
MMQKSKMAPKGDPNYFQLPSVFIMFLIAFGMTLTAMCVYAPNLIPFNYLGFIGDLARYLAYERPKLIAGIWYGAVAIHISEAIFAFYLAGKKGITGCARIKWFISTLCFGIGSLGILLKYDPTEEGAVVKTDQKWSGENRPKIKFVQVFRDESDDDSGGDIQEDNGSHDNNSRCS